MPDIIHVQGFVDAERGARGVKVSIHRDQLISVVAAGVLNAIRESPRTTVDSTWTTRSLDGDLREVEAVTTTTLDDGHVGHMWHLFTTESDRWPVAPPAEETPDA
ncbi:hypothetical protein [Microbacterium sp.]|uniref:hypothetical protein n=1 Tax=Microbacterium sp. TaxID=51671 RepID=UPI003F72C969